jgi:hypothetical protein
VNRIVLRGGFHNYPKLNHYECVFVTGARKSLLGGSLIFKECAAMPANTVWQNWPRGLPTFRELADALCKATVWP